MNNHNGMRRAAGTDLLLRVFCGPALHVFDEILIEVGGEGGGEGAGGSRRRCGRGSRGGVGGVTAAAGDVVGARGGTPVTAAIDIGIV